MLYVLNTKLINKMIVAVVVLMVGFYTNVALAQDDVLTEDAGVKPGSFFYFFDTAGEWMRLNLLTFNGVKKTKLKVKYEEERIAELKEIVEENPGSENIKKLREKISKRVDDISSDINEFDEGGKDISDIVEKINNNFVRHQGVLEDLLEKVPDEAKEAIERALESARDGHARAENILLSQHRKGYVSAEEARDILEKNIEKIRQRIDVALEKAEQISDDDPKKEHFEEIIESRIEHLERRIIDVESGKEIVELRLKLRDKRRDAVERLFEVREIMKRHATSTKEVLIKIRDGSFDSESFEERAAHAIEEAEKELEDAETLFAEAGGSGMEIPESVEKLIRNAKNHLDNSLVAFEERRLGEAFGQAVASYKHSRNALTALKRLLGDDAGDDEHENVNDVGERVKDDVCIAIFKPVCGVNGKTYSNKCRARVAGVEILHEGNCEESDKDRTGNDKSGDNGGSSGSDNALDEVLKDHIEDDVIVGIIDGSFSPRKVTIKKGTKVKWINKNDRRIWPASNIHPTHAIYSGFDARRGIEPGDDYSFVFNRVGIWNYHDHLRPSVTGVIVVEE